MTRKAELRKGWNTCEWCNTTYPYFDRTVYYYEILVFNKKHIICNECLEHLKEIK